MKKIFTVALSTLVLATGCKKDEETAPKTMQISAALSAANELPATSSTASGSVTGTYNPTSRVLNYTVTFSGLTDNATSGHLHYGDTKHMDRTPQIVFSVPAAKSGTFSGTATLTSMQADSLTRGHIYANIHTPTCPAGEIRANVVVK
jgi:hypothetical protein